MNKQGEGAQTPLTDELHLSPELANLIMPFLRRRLQVLTTAAGQQATLIQEHERRLAQAREAYQQISGSIDELMGLIQRIGGNDLDGE